MYQNGLIGIGKHCRLRSDCAYREDYTVLSFYGISVSKWYGLTSFSDIIVVTIVLADGQKSNAYLHLMLHRFLTSLHFSLQVKQKDIESHSRIVSAVLQHCETLQDEDDVFDHEERRDELELSAHNLERHWHEIWLQSLEWQCRLEDALSSGKVRVMAPCS